MENITSETKLEEWLHANPLHRHSPEGGECCPDFSCCHRELLTDDETRRLFYEATKSGNEQIRMVMLMSFLGRALSALGIAGKAYVAGQRDLPQV